MAKATWNGAVLAESNEYELVEGNVYFPPKSVNWEYFKKTDTHTTCTWKGLASYYDLNVGGKVNKDAVWTYLETKEAAMNIKEHVAFGGGVTVEK
ncbi:MAG: DUF427 domain-containing protein [Chloroflexota bacterium]|nr:DUF427 domain-containing protein [Chloroflexota bacterium]